MAQRRAQIKEALAGNRAVTHTGLSNNQPAKQTTGLGAAKPAGGAFSGLGSSTQPIGSLLAQANGTPAPLPWDAISTLEGGAAQRKYGDSQAQIASERDMREREYGLGAGYNVNNPYSQAALLEAQHNAQRKGTLNGAGNQLYAGSTINHLRGADNRFNLAHNDLALSRERDLAGFQGAETAAQRAKEEAEGDAQIGAVERFEQRPLEQAPVQAPAQGAGKTKVKKTTTKAKKKGK